MFESVKRSGVLDNPWLPLILCVVLAVLWFSRWEFQASKTYNDGVAKWHKDRWTGTVWIQGIMPTDAFRVAVTSLEGDDAREYRILEARRAKNLTKAWGCAAVASLGWLLYAVSRRTTRTPRQIL